MANIEKTEKKVSKPKKESRFSFKKIGRYFKDVMGELKKLTWPTKGELASYTLTVVAFIVLMAVIIYVLDLIFAEGISLLSQI